MRIEALVAPRPGTRNFFQIRRSCVTLATGICRLAALAFMLPDAVTTRLFPAVRFAVLRAPVLALPAPALPPRCLLTTPITAIPLGGIIGMEAPLTALQQALAMTGAPLLAAFCLRNRSGP